MKFIFIFGCIAINIAFFIFIKGFFPLKQVSGGYSVNKDKHSEYHTSPTPKYRRLIFMIIDAFRADFAFGPLNFFPKTQRILSQGNGLQFTAEVHPPTVTLPRIKAITTGSTPSFVDVVLNFGASSLDEDNIIAQMKMDGRKIIFFGDDTWLRLFPGYFDRSDGTTSFFVSDYKEVDINVTRHLGPELSNPNWDVMILHYLGLDHIGHISGPSSPLIRPKLAEMDSVVEQIYATMNQWNEPSLLVICGDHGMSDQGGHGGASAGEISVPVLFLSPQIKNKDPRHAGVISQVDLCPTISVLMGLPIPKNNIGKVVTETLFGFSISQKVSIMHRNAKQAIQVLKSYLKDLDKDSAYILYKKAKEQHQDWLLVKNSTAQDSWEELGNSLLVLYSESLSLLAKKVESVATQYDVYSMAIAMVLLWMLLVTFVLSQMKRSPNLVSVSLSTHMTRLSITSGTALLTHITMCTGGVPSDLMCSSSFLSIGVQLTVAAIFATCSLYLLKEWQRCLTLFSQIKVWRRKTSLLEIFLAAGTVTHTFTLLSSSFVEEEHQTYYFLTTTVHLLCMMWLVIHILGLGHGSQLGSTGSTKPLSFNTKILETINKNYATDKTPAVKESCQSGENKFSKDEDFSRQLRNVDNSCEQNYEIDDLDFTDFSVLKKNLKQDGGSTRTLQKKSKTASGGGKKKGKECLEKLKALIHSELFHLSISVAVVIAMLRILRRWNQTGNKWLDTPDIGDWLILTENKNYLSLSVIFSLMIIGATRARQVKRVQSMFINLALTTIYFYRVAGGSLFFPASWFLSQRGIMEARASFILIGVILLMTFLPSNFFQLESTPKMEVLKPTESKFQSKKILHVNKADKTSDLSHTMESPSDSQNLLCNQETTVRTCSPAGPGTDKVADDTRDMNIHQRLNGLSSAFLCFMCLVLRPHNIPVVAMLSLMDQMMTPVLLATGMKPSYILLYCHWMGQAFFFFQGNSNSLSTVDLTAGYTGLSEYIPSVTGPLLCLATYSGTIFWMLTFLKVMSLMYESKEKDRSRISCQIMRSGDTMLLCRALLLSVYTSLVSAQRYHLFVWSVFSPKLLYEGVQTLVLSTLTLVVIFVLSLV